LFDRPFFGALISVQASSHPELLDGQKRNMFSPGILAQIYLTSAILGSAFIIFNFAIGQIEGGGDSSGAGADGGNDFGAGDTGGGHDFGASSDSGGQDFDAGGDSGGNDFGANGGGDGGNAGGHDFNSSSMKMHNVLAQGASPKYTLVPDPDRSESKVGLFILGLLSPMSIAMKLMVFGMAGALLLYLLPWLGFLSIPPAMFAAWLGSNIFKQGMRWMMKNLETSSISKVGDLVGQLAEVNIPFKDGSTGEVTYIVQSKRINSAAQPFKPGCEFKRGMQVLIVEVKDHMVLVEPYADAQMNQS
jgi:hypothetical protein